MILLAIVLHLLLNTLLGLGILSFLPFNRSSWEQCLNALLIGMTLETLAIASLLFVPFSLSIAFWVVCLFTIGLSGIRFRKILHTLRPLGDQNGQNHIVFPRLRWYEILLIGLFLEKVVFGLWQVIKIGIYYEDVVFHWAKVGRLLYGGVNWSVDSQSEYFLGISNAKPHYPLQLPIWRAVNAIINREWNDLLACFDSLIFFLVIVVTTWALIYRFSKLRSLAALGLLAVMTYPLLGWHIGAGFADIAIAAYGIATLNALLRKDWIVAGMLMAGLSWIKNEGMVLFVPALLFGMILLHNFPLREFFSKHRLLPFSQSLLQLLTGYAILIPWLLMRWQFNFQITPNQEGLQWHPQAYPLLFEETFQNPTSGVLWGMILLIILVCFPLFLKDPSGRALLGVGFVFCSGLLIIFSMTDAFEFLINRATYQRSLLQWVPIAVVIGSYGIWLKWKET